MAFEGRVMHRMSSHLNANHNDKLDETSTDFSMETTKVIDKFSR